MRKWSSLEEIVEAFSLPSPSSFPIARAKLLKLQVEYHPDKTSGEFADELHREKYLQIQGAIQYIDDTERKPSKTLPAVVDGRAISPPIKWEHIAENEKKMSDGIRQYTRTKFQNIRISSGVIAVALTTTLAFSKTIMSHPLIQNLVGYLEKTVPWAVPLLGAGLLLVILGAAIAFIRAWNSERKAKAMAESLVTDQGLFDLFRQHSIKTIISKTGRFQLTDIFEAMKSNYEFSVRRYTRYLPPIITEKLPNSLKYRRTYSVFSEDLHLAHQATNLIIEKLLSRGAIISSNTGLLIPEYELSEAAKSQLYGSEEKEIPF
jgi:hypothetical protein